MESIGFGEGEQVNRNDHKRTNKQNNKKYKLEIHTGVDRIDTVDVERDGPMKYDEGLWLDSFPLYIYLKTTRWSLHLYMITLVDGALQRSMLFYPLFLHELSKPKKVHKTRQ